MRSRSQRKRRAAQRKVALVLDITILNLRQEGASLEEPGVQKGIRGTDPETAKEGREAVLPGVKEERRRSPGPAGLQNPQDPRQIGGTTGSPGSLITHRLGGSTARRAGVGLGLCLTLTTPCGQQGSLEAWSVEPNKRTTIGGELQ